jgi:hypothetical protein
MPILAGVLRVAGSEGGLGVGGLLLGVDRGVSVSVVGGGEMVVEAPRIAGSLISESVPQQV